MIDKTEFIALYDQDQRIKADFPDMRREVTPEVVRLIDTANNREGMVVFSRLSESNAEAVIREQVECFEGIGQDFEWKVFDYDQPPDLKERLEGSGFTTGEAEALVVLDMEDAPEFLLAPVRHNVRRITDPGELGLIELIEAQVWDEDISWVQPFLGGALRDYPGKMSIYVATINGQPASAAWIYFSADSPFASLWGGATIKEFRKRGLYTTLLAVRLQEAIARGVRYLTVDASPMSRPILEKFGFEFITNTYACKWRLKN